MLLLALIIVSFSDLEERVYVTFNILERSFSVLQNTLVLLFEMAKYSSYQESKERGEKVFAATVKFGVQSPELNRSTIEYNSTTGLNDTPKGIIDGIKDTLCELDDTLAETSPFVWIPAKFYRLKKSCPELFDIDRDVTQPIERLSPKKSKVKVQGQSERVADDEIKALLKDISSTSEVSLKAKNVKKSAPKSDRYVGSVASDPAVLALLYSAEPKKSRLKRNMKKQKMTPRLSSRIPTARKSTGRRSSRLPGISPLTASAKSTRRSSAYVVDTPPSATAFSPTKNGVNESNSGSNTREMKEPTQETKPKTAPKKKLKGIATVMDLSELSAGLKRKGSLYKDTYNEYGLEKELKTVYAVNAQHWIPRTEQTVINEKMALDRKLRRMIAGLED